MRKQLTKLVPVMLFFMAHVDHASTYMSIYSITAGPVIDENMIYIGDGQGFVYALDTTKGKQQWRVNMGARVDSLVAGKDMVYFQTWAEGDEEHQQFYALEKKSGRLIWQQTVAGLRFGPQISGTKVYSLDYDGVVSVVDAATGKPVSKNKLKTSEWKGHLFLDGSLFLIDTKGRLVALDADNGIELWYLDIQGNFYGRPTRSGDYLFLLCERHYLCAINLAEHKLARKFALDSALALDRWIIHGDMIYYTTGQANLKYDATIRAMSILTGEERWQYVASGTNWLGNIQFEGDRLFFDRDKQQAVGALDVATGKLLWQFKIKRDNWPMYFLSNVLYFAGFDGIFYAVEADTGTLIWQYRTGSMSASENPATYNGNIYFCTRDGRMIAADLKTGTRKWEFKSKAWKRFNRETRRENGGAESLQISGPIE